MKINQALEKLNIQRKDGTKGSRNASFVFRNLPNELALTVGNYLRRILLSYVDGIAITAVKIGNEEQTLQSEFIPLKGILETPPFLILNLKELVLKSNNDSLIGDFAPLKVDIANDSSEEYVVTGKDVQSENSEIEVLNKNLHIATVSPDSKLNIEIYCQKLWGFERQSEQNLSLVEKGVISVDSNYNPVKSVSFKVDMVVVDLDRQEEQLTIDIKTNGSISAQKALSNALEISHQINSVLFEKLSEADSELDQSSSVE